ncbi:class I SAM-dependent methyltransferase [Oscillatoria sp. FACHB-1406]|uniref:class I SAM-dependent methyltransferase n=1 Tax=Oscillatoria sp. FACHB-1406 TaxID=2692846 RepID=UPI00168471A5|nr:class I SAM-dependent methyltransferase [Oscillatoria sp. FACHB-1406]MBD2577804.1 class I SAM-dependent methyltransferase [Oscillatoria sp. FACHB-1406]
MKTPIDSKEKFAEDWEAYYDAIANRPPRNTLLKALKGFKTPGLALDLGCGDGRDTVELLRCGWEVLAVDAQPEAIARLLDRTDIDPARLKTQVERFETFAFPNNIDLINASFSLPFSSPLEFPRIWAGIVAALSPGGRFCGHFFGERDSWAAKGWIHPQTRSQIEQLLQFFTVEMLEEEEHPGTTPLGEERDWHIFHVVARKPQ